LQKQFVGTKADLEPEIRRIVFGDQRGKCGRAARPMTMQQRSVGCDFGGTSGCKSSADPLVSRQIPGAHGAFLFAPKDPEFFCMRQNASARERVERTKELLAP